MRVEPLDPARHRVSEFVCGTPMLDRWLHANAGQAHRRDVARTFVAVDEDGQIAGYYTLVAGQVEHGDASTATRAGVSRHFPIPVGLIARLAVALSWQRRGLGTDLVRDALRRILGAAEEIGIRAVVVHAIDADAAGFYGKLGFEAATPGALTLMVPLAAVRKRLLEG